MVRVLAGQGAREDVEELTEDEKSEWAMDIAYDSSQSPTPES